MNLERNRVNARLRPLADRLHRAMSAGRHLGGIVLRGIAPRRRRAPAGAGHAHGPIRARLSEYLDGSLAPHGCARIEAHLATCAACGAFARTLRHTVALLHRLPEVPMPAPARERLRERLATEARERVLV